ncbi:MAG: helix-turn-helix transcriptional regulator, partial [Firmicutes bacterium]|nr:helix-turn-helix transcriptional regulator [Bacillota bacterium]
EFWELFINSETADRFEHGESTVIAGMSGIEMAYAVLGDGIDRVDVKAKDYRTQEYWLGWALAYYQWETGLAFREIAGPGDIMDIRSMYSPYHEMDIRQFCDAMDEICFERNRETRLKYYRKLAGLSQAQLAEQSDIPLRTIQQYEQRQKNINMARAEYVISLARVLCCSPEDLMEKISIVSRA